MLQKDYEFFSVDKLLIIYLHCDPPWKNHIFLTIFDESRIFLQLFFNGADATRFWYNELLFLPRMT